MHRTVKNKLFGTDGIRSEFGVFPLDRESVVKLGNVLGRLLKGTGIVIGRDTRRSGEEIVKLLASGISNETTIVDCGVIPTPGLSRVTRSGNYDYGIMITASHNPWTDNGIKIFKSDGEKISEELERQLEEAFYGTDSIETLDRFELPAAENSKAGYIDFLNRAAEGLPASAGKSFNIILDCANGATFEIAPRVFREAGFNIEVIADRPDGMNINLECGSTHLDGLARRVKMQRADLGIAFDGDGDRVLMVDALGNTLDGDHTLYLIAKYLLETYSDFNKVVVGTVLGNLGLENALREMGIAYARTGVGDKYVYEEMKRQGSVLGGEQSGHTILRQFQCTGDGILTALYFLKALFYFDISPAGVFRELRLYPQQMVSLKVREKPDLKSWEPLNRMIDDFNRMHGTDSRILIRYSGTEPRIRIMIESVEENVIYENMTKFEEFIKKTIGI
jgi:phosphoglucosamine mutase